jgi:hypothetical protein
MLYVLMIPMLVNAALHGWFLSRGKNPVTKQQYEHIFRLVAIGLLIVSLAVLLLTGVSTPSALLALAGVPTWHAPLLFAIGWLMGMGVVNTLLRRGKELPIAMQETAPQKSTWALWLAVWAVYLMLYEFWMRGILLVLPAAEHSTTWLIVANTILYSVIHMPKSKRESIVSVPFGIVVCLITIYTGNFWGAFAIHVGLSWAVLVWRGRERSKMNDRVAMQPGCL